MGAARAKETRGIRIFILYGEIERSCSVICGLGVIYRGFVYQRNEVFFSKERVVSYGNGRRGCPSYVSRMTGRTSLEVLDLLGTGFQASALRNA